MESAFHPEGHSEEKHQILKCQSSALQINEARREGTEGQTTTHVPHLMAADLQALRTAEGFETEWGHVEIFFFFFLLQKVTF